MQSLVLSLLAVLVAPLRSLSGARGENARPHPGRLAPLHRALLLLFLHWLHALTAAALPGRPQPGPRLPRPLRRLLRGLLALRARRDPLGPSPFALPVALGFIPGWLLRGSRNRGMRPSRAAPPAFRTAPAPRGPPTPQNPLERCRPRTPLLFRFRNINEEKEASKKKIHHGDTEARRSKAREKKGAGAGNLPGSYRHRKWSTHASTVDSNPPPPPE